jgi:hypothetical protein
MENQTRFDLNAAIIRWREESAAQLDLTTDVRRELESHLLDSFQELREKGVVEEECFWLARHRIGDLKKIGKEFTKADPAMIWKERVFWMACAVLLSWLWNITSTFLAMLFSKLILNTLIIHDSSFSTSPSFQMIAMHAGNILFRYCPLLLAVWYLLKGRAARHEKLLSFFHSRWRFGAVFGAWSLINSLVATWFNAQMAKNLASTSSPGTTVSFPVLENLIYSLSLSLAGIGLVLWLMPKRGETRPEMA